MKIHKAHHVIKQWIWVYIFLLIFEGALRKWVLPYFSDLLLIVRDPILIGLIIYAWYNKIFVTNIYIQGVWLIGIISFVLTMWFGHENIYVAVYGLRILLIYFPFIFLIGKVFTREDVIRLGKVILLLSIPMTVLIAFQFYSPQSAWINRGLGGSLEGAGFSGANGYYRPPGTFSFISGTVAFYSLATCYIWYFWFNKNEIKKWLLVLSTVLLFCTIPISISRTLFFQILLTSVFAFMYILLKLKNPNIVIKFSIIACFLLSLFYLISEIPFLQEPMAAFYERFTTANESEGGTISGVLGNRYFGGFMRELLTAQNVPLSGFGLGMGTNVGSSLLVGGRSFLISEGEWGRVIGEQGTLLGLTFILIRVWFTVRLFVNGYLEMLRHSILPWMLLSCAITYIPQGQWAQPTILGFSVLFGGITIASFRK